MRLPHSQVSEIQAFAIPVASVINLVVEHVVSEIQVHVLSP